MRRAPVLDLDGVLVEVLAGAPDQPATAAGPGDGVTDAVLDAATGLLAEHGARHWTIDDVAERAGAGRATVYRRFNSRDELMRAAVTREARRFFTEVADSVRDVESLEDKVVRGFVTGVRLALNAPLGSLLRRDPAASISLLGSEALLRAATTALTERYEAVIGHPLSGPARAEAEAAAEALVRLGLSFVLVPGPLAESEPWGEAHERLAAIIRPLVGGRRPPGP